MQFGGIDISPCIFILDNTNPILRGIPIEKMLNECRLSGPEVPGYQEKWYLIRSFDQMISLSHSFIIPGEGSSPWDFVL